MKLTVKASLINETILNKLHYLLLLSIITWTIDSKAQIAVTPSVLEIDSTEINKTHSFRIINKKEHAVHVSTNVESWTLDEMNQVQPIPLTADSLTNWVIVNPLNFTLEPNSTQTIRLALRPPNQIPEGEHRLMLYFNQQLKEKPKEGTINFKFKIGSAIYVHIGEKIKTGKTLSAKIENQHIRLETMNTGNSFIRYKGHWLLWLGEPNSTLINLENILEQESPQINGLLAKGEMPSMPVLPGYTRMINVDISDYELNIPHDQPLTLQFIGRLGDETVDTILPINVN